MQNRRFEMSVGAFWAIIIALGCGAPASDDFTYGEYSSRPDLPATDDAFSENGFVDTMEHPSSTFVVDVDNASYTYARNELRRGKRPSPESVRPEEYVNYFDYDYQRELDGEAFSVDLAAAPSPFGSADSMLLRIGLQGRAVSIDDMKPTRLTFVVDHSGSMIDVDDEVRETLRIIASTLRPQDAISIVVFEARPLVLLDRAFANETDRIDRAIARLDEPLSLGGITDGEVGLEVGYEQAKTMFNDDANNRLVLLSDGGFNDGVIDDELIDLVQQQYAGDISLTTLGFGDDSYSDYNLEGLAHVANGNYFYIDSSREAERLFRDRLPSVVEIIASDVKAQVEFNPETVSRYRLIGYDDRALADDAYADADQNAGEVGAGHTVTALYELELRAGADDRDLLAEVRLSHAETRGGDRLEHREALKVSNVLDSFATADHDFRFAAAVAEFAEILRDSRHVDIADFAAVERIAAQANPDGQPEREEFLELVRAAR